MAEEATINPDGSQEMPPTMDPEESGGEMPLHEVLKATDPAYYLLLLVVIVAVLVFVLRKKSGDDDFFDELDGEKFNLKLPSAVDEYNQIKAKMIASGQWKADMPPPTSAAAAEQSGPHRVLAQALMKRCIADIPIVQHIQKESTGMNKLYSQSMCSVKQWRSYQAAETLVGNEVDAVRAEADEIEPGWSNVIWRQAMQYHTMLKQKQESEAKAAEAAAQKKKQMQDKAQAEKQKVLDAENRAAMAEKLAAELAAELIQEEEKEKKQGGTKKTKKASSGGMKKGFLNKKK